MAKYVPVIVGGLELAGGIAGMLVAPGNPFSAFLIQHASQFLIGGIGTVLAGVGTLLAKGPMHGVSTAQRNPIAPWNVVYGQSRMGGSGIYVNWNE